MHPGMTAMRGCSSVWFASRPVGRLCPDGLFDSRSLRRRAAELGRSSETSQSSRAYACAYAREAGGGETGVLLLCDLPSTLWISPASCLRRKKALQLSQIRTCRTAFVLRSSSIPTERMREPAKDIDPAAVTSYFKRLPLNDRQSPSISQPPDQPGDLQPAVPRGRRRRRPGRLCCTAHRSRIRTGRGPG